MGKYRTVEDDIYKVFAQTQWKIHKIPAMPSNFESSEPHNTFIRLNIIPSSNGVNRVSVEGQLLIEIFIPAKKATKPASLIADILDNHLVGTSHRTENGLTQFPKGSTFAPDGVDPADPGLFRFEYNISFSYFGVT